MNDARKLINSLKIKDDEVVIVACSGGPDSMFLLNLLIEANIKVVCAHVNHKLRSESDDEYEFLKKYAHDKNIIFEGIELTGYDKGNFENYARNFRYSFFEKLIEKYKSNYLFTAHHGDDLMETILMRLVRGSSLKGYKAFLKITDNKTYKIVRPLVYLTKDEILKYNEINNTPYVLDYTNDLDDYTRNRFRHNILPALKDEDSLVHLKFLQFSEILDDAYSYIKKEVLNYLNQVYQDDRLNLKEFNKLDPFIKTEIIASILNIKYPDNLYLVNKNHLNEILKIIKSDKKNITTCLPGMLTIKKEYDFLYFLEENIKVDSYEYILEDELILPNGDKIKKIDKESGNSNYIIYLNSKDIKLPLIVRTRKLGDKMQVKNMKGHKKINDIFIDSKQILKNRDSWPIVTDQDGVILWVPGLKKSNFDVQNDGLYDIILWYERGGKTDEK